MGSGKTVVAKQFCDNGFMLIDADVIARKVVEKGSITLEKLAQSFGEDIINDDGTLNRRLLAKRAFVSKEKSEMLNQITHPAIIELVKSEISRFYKQGHTKIIYDAPLLFESGSDKLCDKVVTVIADVNKRIERIKSRDNLSDTEIKNRLDSQHDDSFYVDKSDYVIYNNFSLEKLLEDTMNVISTINEVHDVTLC